MLISKIAKSLVLMVDHCHVCPLPGTMAFILNCHGMSILSVFFREHYPGCPLPDDLLGRLYHSYCFTTVKLL